MKLAPSLDNPLTFAAVALSFGTGWPLMAKLVAMIMQAPWK